MRTVSVRIARENGAMTDTPGRLLRLLSLLQQRTDWSGPELAGRLAVTTRTVRRDVGRLRSLGYPVDSLPGNGGGYRLGTGVSLPPLLLDEDEAAAVAIALGASAGGAVTGVEDHALAVLTKLHRLLPPHLRARVEAVRTTTVGLGGAETVAAGVLVTVAAAAAERRRLELTYVDRRGRRTERRMDPYRLVATGRRWYVAAWDVDRQDWRTLRADRIERVRPTGHRFVLDDPPDARELVARAIAVSPHEHEARVVVEAAPEVVLARIGPGAGLVAPHERGTLLTVGGDDVVHLASYLVALGFVCEVLDPPELRALIRDMGERLAAAHA
jgi:predicted DNA-binding transcriptional regulator YafY